MEYLFFITLVLLLVALFFVWKFWRERNAYREAYGHAFKTLQSLDKGIIPAIAKGLLAGALVTLFLRAISRIRGEENSNE